MTKIKKALAATDFSEQSRLAIRRAALICQEHSARLELLHVVEEFPPPELITPDQFMEEARRKLQDEAESALSLGVECGCRVETGKDFVAIIQSARKVTADLIVVGAHGRHSLRDNFFGTTAQKLVRKAGIPVLVVKQPARSSYRRLLVPTDFSEASLQALSSAKILAPGAAIDLLHVYGFWGEEQLSMAHASEKARERYRQRTELWATTSMDEWLQGVDLAGTEVEEHVRKGYASSAIVQFATQRSPDLVAMGTVGRSGHRNVLLGSVTEHVLRTVPCDILAVRSGEFHFELP
jgi:universal stress protein E